MSEYVHIKTGNIYHFLGEAINATNDRNGQVVILYRSENGGPVYVREKGEFLEKFKSLDKQEE